MALATAQGLAGEFETIFIGPPGVALEEARRLGFQTRQYITSLDLAKVLAPLLKQYKSELTFVGTGPRYNLVCMALNLLYRRKIKQIQMVHGGSGVEKDYRRKKILNHFGVTFVVVSDWSKQRLIEHGVACPIEVIGNFLTAEQMASIRPRPAYDQMGIRKVVVVSRVDQLKRVDLLLDALDRRKSELADLSFKILGVGPEFERLRERARQTHPNVDFAGFSDDVAGEMARADLLLHTCAVETFGLAVLEAMAVKLVSLVPDQGGTAMLIQDGRCGFTYQANDADHLAQRLTELKGVSGEVFNTLVDHAYRKVHSEYSAQSALKRYRDVFSPV